MCAGTQLASLGLGPYIKLIFCGFTVPTGTVLTLPVGTVLLTTTAVILTVFVHINMGVCVDVLPSTQIAHCSQTGYKMRNSCIFHGAAQNFLLKIKFFSCNPGEEGSSPHSLHCWRQGIQHANI